jgi:two-component system OmpR family response regulator
MAPSCAFRAWSFACCICLRNAGQALEQGAILEHLYDLESERQPNAVEVLISRLRRKIGQQRIETVRGFGYRLVP